MQGIQETKPDHSVLSIQGYDSIIDNFVYGSYVNPLQTDLITVQKFNMSTDSDIHLNLLPLLEEVAVELPGIAPSKIEFYIRNLVVLRLHEMKKKAISYLNSNQKSYMDVTTGDQSLYVRKGRFPSKIVYSLSNSNTPDKSLVRYIPEEVYEKGCNDNISIKEWVEVLFDHVKSNTPVYGQRWSRKVSIEEGLPFHRQIKKYEEKAKKMYYNDVTLSLTLLMNSFRRNPDALSGFDDLSGNFLDVASEKLVKKEWDLSREEIQSEISNHRVLESRLNLPDGYPLSRIHGDESLPC